MAPIPPVGKRGALESVRRDQLPATLGSPHPIAMILEQDGQFRIRDLVIDEREAKLESDRAAAKGQTLSPEQHYDLGKPTGTIHIEAKTREAFIATIAAMEWPENW